MMQPSSWAWLIAAYRKGCFSCLALITACLLAIWPLPGTIALRQLLLVIGLILSLPILQKNIDSLMGRAAWPIWSMAAFFAWLALHLAFFSVNVQEQWHELRSDWLRSLIAALVGISLGLALADPRSSDSHTPVATIELILFAGLSGTVAIFFFRYLYEIYITAQWVHENFFMTPYKSKTPIVIFGAILLPMAFIRILAVLRGTERTFWLWGAVSAVALTLFADYFANTKNGFAVLLLVTLFFLAGLIRNGGQQRSHPTYFVSVLISLLVIGGFGVKKHLESNEAWHMLWSDIKIGIAIDQNNYWKDVNRFPLPINDHNALVNQSTYLRTAWAVAGLQLLKENPLGYGLIHHSFGALAETKWRDFVKPKGKMRGATHSGWLDLTLGVGLPGLLLIVMPVAESFRRALGASNLWLRYVVWTAPTLVFAYTITEVSSDHFIELLFFVVAFLCGLTLKRCPTLDRQSRIAASA